MSIEQALVNLPLHKDSQVCRLAQSFNDICGCYGTGYGGASTQSKQAALVWAPRNAAIMSFCTLQGHLLVEGKQSISCWYAYLCLICLEA